MKKFFFNQMLFVIASLMIVGCGKTKECEAYSPWPSSDAIAAWTEYSSVLLDDMGAYNSVATIVAYLGSSSYVHDSAVVKHDGDSVLISGYLKPWRNFGDVRIFLVSDQLYGDTTEIMRNAFISVTINSHGQDLDTLSKSYFPAKLLAYKFPEEYASDLCCSFSYVFLLDTENAMIKYEE